MIVFAALSVEQVLPFLATEHEHNDKSKKTFITSNGDFTVKVNTKRLQCFVKSGIKCVACGIKGSLFHIERHSREHSAISPHLNLYAKKDEELILMTQDHIIPKSKGGKDHLANLQTMCFLCNEKKGTTIIPVALTV